MIVFLVYLLIGIIWELIALIFSTKVGVKILDKGVVICILNAIFWPLALYLMLIASFQFIKYGRSKLIDENIEFCLKYDIAEIDEES